MQMIRNQFKRRMLAGEVQYGLWVGLTDPICAEIAACAEFDWLLLDAEHAPNDIRTLLSQLQAIAPYATQAIVRPVEGRVSLIKQMLDLGAQTLLVPMVESAEQAQELVRAVRYPPGGIRGVGTALARAARWNLIKDYFQEANDEICLVLQVESQTAIDNLPAIAAVEGVDAVFVGPADLAGSLGHLGKPTHPEVQAVIEKALTTIVKAGKAAGVVAANKELAESYVKHGATFVGVGTDTVLLAQTLKQLKENYI